MDIPREIKAGIFSQYVGSSLITWGNASTNNRTTYPLTFKHIFDIALGIRIMYDLEPQLILKPIHEISDEDISEIIKIEFGQGDSPTIYRTENYTKIVFKVNGIEKRISFEKYFDGDPIKSEVRLNKIILIYQYLQTKGYDAPQYILGGKTLNQSGLAIYTNN